MPFPDLQSFIAELDKRDQIRRVKVEVDPVLEITEIAERMMKLPSPEGVAGSPQNDPVHGDKGGRGLLFENVKGSSISVVINTFGSYARWKGHFFSIFTDHLSPENVYLMTHIQKAGRPYTLLIDQDASDKILAGTHVLFLHTESLKHDETV